MFEPCITWTPRNSVSDSAYNSNQAYKSKNVKDAEMSEQSVNTERGYVHTQHARNIDVSQRSVKPRSLLH